MAAVLVSAEESETHRWDVVWLRCHRRGGPCFVPLPPLVCLSGHHVFIHLSILPSSEKTEVHIDSDFFKLRFATQQQIREISLLSTASIRGFFWGGVLDTFLKKIIFTFIFLVTPWHMEFSGQGSDPNCSCDLSHSCSHPGSLTHCAWLGIEPVSHRARDCAHPIAPQQELHS